MIYRILFLFCVFCSTFGAVDIRKYLKVCDRNSPDVSDCLVDAVAEGIQTMSNGIPELGVPGVDPYHQKELRVDYSRNQIQATITMKQIIVAGLKASTVKDARLKADDDKFHLEVDMFTPRVRVTGRYRGEGGYNAIFVNTTGDFSVNMTDLTYTWKLDGKPEVIDGKTYVRINSFYMHPDLGDLKADMTNENPEFAEIIRLGVTLSNENWRTFYKELLPYAQANWNKIGIKVANKIFLKVPYDEIFPNKS
ncbi:putative beta-carotene-binding protein [Aricia agestis]|uniref:putative beta-carotene-binding protein n=1 Tax=Aricia agestis TaxID=91739 RepID=UPI001C20760A|nr:putative beta-carotene-binding protein [Aricia agestis]